MVLFVALAGSAAVAKVCRLLARPSAVAEVCRLQAGPASVVFEDHHGTSRVHSQIPQDLRDMGDSWL